MNAAPALAAAASVAAARCLLCGAQATALYRNVPDLLVGSPGAWNVLRCTAADCGALTLSPQPSGQVMADAYKDYFTHDEGIPIPQGIGIRNRARRAFQQRVLGYPFGGNGVDVPLGRLYGLSPIRREVALRELFYVSYVPGGRLLEVGCGNGRQLERLAQAGWKVEGLDFDERAVQTARKLGLDVKTGDLESARYPDAHFDAVILSHVIEHVPDPVGLLAECRRVLRPGGQLVLATPNSDSWGHRSFGKAWLGLDPPRHLLVFTPRALARAAQRAGFAEALTTTKAIASGGWFLASVWRARALSERKLAPLPNGREHIPFKLRALSLFERLACHAGRAVGEEIILSARK
jgi:2-polyprenyl-3-methyl-5-hydroxy-6-metoxy-1,4-benzoquinol methylase